MGRKTGIVLGCAALVIVGLLILPAGVEGQCTTSITNGPGTWGTPAYIYVGKAILNANTCTLTGFNNVIGCAPGGFPPTATGATNSGSYVSASALTAATNPFCAWNCDCGQVIIGPGDGLPVELMAFSVE